MSIYSGKCDLADHLFMMKFRTKDGSDKKEDLEKASVFYSDEMECFKIFKERTDGKIYQYKTITVTPWNYDEVERLTNGVFKAIPHTKVVEDKRLKSGQREQTTYTYEYYGHEYKTLKELNKQEVFFTDTIEFNTLLDLIPYYPYIVCMSNCFNGKETVVISENSYVDYEREEGLKHGYHSDFWKFYKKHLQDHYREVVLRYFNPEGREHIESVVFNKVEYEDGSHLYLGKVSHPIDENFDVRWNFEGDVQTHWTSPKVSNAKDGIIVMSDQDYDTFLGDVMSVYYVEEIEYPLYLN